MELANVNRTIRSCIKKIPFVSRGAQYFLRKYNYIKLKKLSAKDVFTEIHQSNYWGDRDSVSGPGSNLAETAVVRERLPELIKQFRISSLLDIPCGDYYWMKGVDLEGVEYIGADIVLEIVEKNRTHEAANIRFDHLNLILDRLPSVDMIMVRDCLVHFSNEHIYKSLQNICSSNSKYLLTTIFTARTENRDIATGQWRALNLQINPFGLPEPLLVINENHPSKEWKDKSLGLWSIADIDKNLPNAGT